MHESDNNAPDNEKPAVSVRRDDRDDGIAVLVFDRPGSSANIFDTATLDALDRQLDRLAGDAKVKGVILSSAKPAVFVAGADLNALQNADPGEMRAMVEKGQSVFQKLADLRVPTAAAIHGSCVGGGLEVALACDWRAASPDKTTKIGLPETMLGILPAWGGSTRLPRLIGLPKAIALITSGKLLHPKQARKLGIIDNLAPRERLESLAAQWILRNGKAKRKSFFLFNNRLAAPVIASIARRKILAQTRGLYPAPIAALRVMKRGVTTSIPRSLDYEREAVMELGGGEVAKNLIRIFHLQEHSRKLRYLPADASDSALKINRTAVIGAGVMGSGIAQWLAARGFPVILQDIEKKQVAAGMRSITKLNAAALKRRIFTPLEARRALDLIQPSAVPVPLERADIVIEAATENLEVKKKIFRDLCARARPDTVLATNTSALPISELASARGVTHPERILGLHFFNPVHRMQLVEVVVPESTSPETVRAGLAFLHRIGKFPVVVKDSPGFLVNRILLPYLSEAGRLYDSGVEARAIDRAMLDFGMPMGPIRLLDEVGLDVGLHVAETLEAAFGDRFAVPEILRRMVDGGNLGRKSGAGFYQYPSGRSSAKPKPNPQALALRSVAIDHPMDPGEISARLSLLMVNESFRCLEEKIASSGDDIDFAMILGTGFAPFRGGPIAWARASGLNEARASLSRLARLEGLRFAPAALLIDKKARRVPAPEDQSNPDEPSAMKSAEQESNPQDPGDAQPASVIDTSKMSPEERAALELTEAARQKAGPRGSFSSSLFMGRPDFRSILPFPAQSVGDEERSAEFLDKLKKFLDENVDADEIDRTGEIPDKVIEGLAEMGAFGIKIPAEYGGLGLSQTTYSRAAMLMGACCGNITALVSAHQSIGVPQPLVLFGTEEQKKKFLPRCAKGEISAFALTEPDVGSDPAKMATTATLEEGGGHYLLNGEKLWCTNVLKAGMIVVMAKTPPPDGAPPSARSISAFVVEMNTPGIEVTHRCRFMGLKALYNGVITFKDVRVPKENIILGEGRGLKVALTTLNTGRITLPAACVGLAKECLEITRKWSSERVQWGAAIGKHDAIAQKLAKIAADTFAMESMVLYTSALVDGDKKADIRIEAAFGKLWGSEQGWRIADETMQIRGGRGYETADSLKARGDDPIPVERFLRDSRINTIFEGSSEIMRLFIAREALDPHLRVAGPVLNSTLPTETRLRAALKSAGFYLKWYPPLWLPAFTGAGSKTHPALKSELRQVRARSRKLARKLFHAMVVNGPKLEKKQALLGRFVDIGAALFAITATCSRAQHMIDSGKADNENDLLNLVRYFCKSTRLQIDHLFRSLGKNADKDGYRVARSLLTEVKKPDAS